MNVNGSSTRRKIDPDSSTTTENMRPASDWSVMSPNPRVVIVTSVQYALVGQLCDWPSRAISQWNVVLKITTSAKNRPSSTKRRRTLRRRNVAVSVLRIRPRLFIAFAAPGDRR